MLPAVIRNCGHVILHAREAVLTRKGLRAHRSLMIANRFIMKELVSRNKDSLRKERDFYLVLLPLYLELLALAT